MPCSRSAETARAASSECPPRSVKKFDSTDTESASSPKTSAHTARTRCSASPSAGTTGPSATANRRPEGAGSRLRSTFPLGITGNEPTTSIKDGTM